MTSNLKEIYKNVFFFFPFVEIIHYTYSDRRLEGDWYPGVYNFELAHTHAHTDSYISLLHEQPFK